MGPRSAALGGGEHVGGSTGAAGGDPRGATKRCAGWVNVPNCVCGTRADGPLGASVKLPMGPRKGCQLGRPASMRTVPLGDSVELPKRCSGWGELPNWVCETHVGGPTWGFGGAPYWGHEP
eukprot:6648065-Pyramimonas_sp.AAC.1